MTQITRLPLYRSGSPLTMYDSDTPGDIPQSAAMVAGYDNGYAAAAWSAPGGWDRFPNVPRVHVAVTAVNLGDVLDIENGDAVPSEAPGWVTMRQRAGVVFPVCYCDRASRPYVENALTAAGFNGSQVGLWIATLDGVTTQVAVGPFPVVAVQYAGQTSGSGGHYDLSVVYGPWPGILSSAPTGGVLDMLPEPPFTIAVHAGAHWFDHPGGADQGLINAAAGTQWQVGGDEGSRGPCVDASGYYRPNIGDWWVRADQVGVLMGGGGVAGPAGPPGPPGPPGPAGPQGAPGIAAGAKVRLNLEGTIE